MSEKAKTSISIKRPVYEAALKIADSEDRDFSFIVERALIGELRAAGIEVVKANDPVSELIAAAEEAGGISAATRALQRLARRTSRRAA